ncbi:Transmembrane adaptor Erv26 [Kalmanozyma brasiliensis GHG001]|uniref:Transmembrane adaptor Erv26 n=1 Tax=Kalmanozyma brasiliensis (strain GHG001) TaxID=1365824 RepID=UPI002868017D|nr:Transmembrane adaptor Erv26 [Kalmanozyma brasiliensis GHG001]KAF6767316.1 Transmembrane adaptor Erv26 [Kalmanozyma brasiliensis GHG001]
MILTLLTGLFVVAAGAALVVCLALGLLSLSQYIESHANRSRRLALRTLYLVLLIQALLVLDGVPLAPFLPGLAAALLHRSALLDPSWPFSPASSVLTSLASLLVLPLASHILLIRHHTLTSHTWHQHRYDTLHRAKLPGGRLDWDVPESTPGQREMTSLQVCAVLSVCVWSIPVVRLLGRIAAAEWGSAGVVDGRVARRSSGR